MSARNYLSSSRNRFGLPAKPAAHSTSQWDHSCGHGARPANPAFSLPRIKSPGCENPSASTSCASMPTNALLPCSRPTCGSTSAASPRVTLPTRRSTSCASWAFIARSLPPVGTSPSVTLRPARPAGPLALKHWTACRMNWRARLRCVTPVFPHPAILHSMLKLTACATLTSSTPPPASVSRITSKSLSSAPTRPRLTASIHHSTLWV